MSDDFWEERQELDDLRRKRIELTDRYQVIQKQLQPFYAQELHLKNQLIRTHHAARKDDNNYVVIALNLDIDVVADRRALWPEWDALHREFRPLIDERRYVITKGKEIAKQIGHIEAWIEKEKKRKRKH